MLRGENVATLSYKSSILEQLRKLLAKFAKSQRENKAQCERVGECARSNAVIEIAF